MRGLSGRSVWVCCLAAVSSVFALGIGASTASALEYETTPAKVQPEHWHPRFLPRGESPIEGHAFTFQISSGYCLGLPKPELDHVRLVERPKTAARPFKSAVITAFLLYPEHQLVIPPADHPDNVIYNGCAGLGLTFQKRVKLKRPAAGLFLYDGSYSPPRRLWPPLGS